MSDRVAELRARIDAADDAIVDALAVRADAVAELWALKTERGVSRVDPAREAALYARLRARAEAAGLDADAVEAVFRGIVGVELRG